MRGQWSRDDPAFLLLLCAVLGGTGLTLLHTELAPSPSPAVASLVFSAWMRLSAVGYLLALLWAVLGDGLVAGVIVATTMW